MGFTFSGEAYVPKHQPPIWHHLYVCRKCWEAIVVKLARRGITQAENPKDCSGDPVDEGYEILHVYPKQPRTNAPDHVPDEIAQDYQEAMDSLKRQNWTSAGMMFRKVLQRATSAIGPASTNFTKNRLKKRIAVLTDQHKLTPAMGGLAHLIREEGDSATHEEKEVWTKKEAGQIQSFSELFLLYAFTLPGLVKQAKEKTDSKDDTPVSS